MSPSMLCLVSVQWQQWQMGSVVFAEWEHAYVEQDVGAPPHATPSSSRQGRCYHPDFGPKAANAVTAPP